jgi:hypothetical protein
VWQPLIAIDMSTSHRDYRRVVPPHKVSLVREHWWAWGLSHSRRACLLGDEPSSTDLRSYLQLCLCRYLLLRQEHSYIEEGSLVRCQAEI